MSEPPATSAAPAAPAKAELGSKDAVVAAGDDADDEAATSRLGTSAPATSGAAEQAAPGAAAHPAGKPHEQPPEDAPTSAPSAEGSSGVPPVTAETNAGFSFGSGLAKSVGGGFGGSGFGALAGAEQH